MQKPFLSDSDESDEARSRFRKNKPIFSSDSDDAPKKPPAAVKIDPSKKLENVTAKPPPLSFQNSESSDEEYDYKKRVPRSANGNFFFNFHHNQNNFMHIFGLLQCSTRTRNKTIINSFRTSANNPCRRTGRKS
jgi:hypothetical protein